MLFKQYKRRNFFIADVNITISYHGVFKVTKVFKSYKTIVGFEVDNKDLYFTKQKYSMTTSKQITMFINESKQLYVDRLPASMFNNIVNQFA